MSGKRILDAAAIFKASRTVAARVLARRKRQWDENSKTSTLSKAVKSQTDRITLTVQAASALADRFHGPGLAYSTKAGGASKVEKDSPVPSQTSVGGAAETFEQKRGLEQDHFYEKSQNNTTAETLHEDQLGIKQERANEIPLPDGSIPPLGAGDAQAKHDKDVFSDVPLSEASKQPLSGHDQAPADSLKPSSSSSSSIPVPKVEAQALSANKARRLQRQAEKQIPSQAAEPPPTEASDPASALSSVVETKDLGVDQEQDTFYTPSPKTGNVLSALPRVKLPKSTEDTQRSNPHVADGHINQDVFYSSDPVHGEGAVPQTQALPERDAPSEEMLSELFHSPKVAKMLKNQPHEGRSSKVVDPLDAQAPQPGNAKSEKGNDQVSVTKRDREFQEQPSRVNTTSTQEARAVSAEEDAKKLAEDMAKDAESSQVGLNVMTQTCGIITDG